MNKANRHTSLHICGTETIRGKIFSREDILATRNFRDKTFSQEDNFAGRYFRVNSIFAKISSRENISNSLFAKVYSRENNVLYSSLFYHLGKTFLSMEGRKEGRKEFVLF